MNSEILGVLDSVLMSRAYSLQELPSNDSIDIMIDEFISTVENEPAVVRLNGNYVIVGDIHGNVDDLLQIFGKLGYPPDTSYVFLGDYVDRGENSIEVLLVLYSLKCLFPQTITLLRGNHESQAIASNYRFRNECESRLNYDIYQRFIQSFSELSICAIINDEVFCVHGGISQLCTSVKELEIMEKPQDVESSPIVLDMLWSDPKDINDLYCESDRGAGHIFSLSAANSFMKENNLKKIIRSHEFSQSGLSFPYLESDDVVTIFSNCDYCGFKNDAVVAKVEKGKEIEFERFQMVESSMKRVIMPSYLLNSADQNILDSVLKLFLTDIIVAV